jgi:putative ABC transport system substrate-binding protein
VKRRQFITLLGGAVAWPVAARAQQPAMPVIGFLYSTSADAVGDRLRAFHRGLKETGYVEGENVAMAYRWGEGQNERLPALASELVRRRVDVIAAPNLPAALAAKATVTTTPVVFAVSEDPVSLGLVASLGRPGGNVTGINFLSGEVMAKRLALLRLLVPGATRVAVLVNPTNPNSETVLRDVEPAARAIGLQVQVVRVSTSQEIDAAFATLERERPSALIAGNDGFFTSRRVQLALLAVQHSIPTAFAAREIVEAGALMSYGADIGDAWRQAGAYIGRILKSAKPADLPVMQASKFELIINAQTAKLLRLTVSPQLVSIADEVIE